LSVFPGVGYADAPVAVYRVTVTNLTVQGQPFTPPLLATHRKPVGLFEVGAPASLELKEIAENGNLDPMLAFIESNKHVAEHTVAVAGDPPPLMPGQSVTVDISAQRGAKYLSFVSMLICTNDGFTGLDGLRLPKKVGDSLTDDAYAYDAGTEINSEDFADLVPPCPALTGATTGDPGSGMSDPALAEGGVIHHHEGIQGGVDLDPNIYDWTNPVVRVDIVRIQ
jgi:hypothetical protein